MTEKIDFQAFMAAPQEGQNAEYEAAFNAYCDSEKLEADRARFFVAADRTTGLEHDSNIRKMAEIDTAIDRIRATLRGIQDQSPCRPSADKEEEVAEKSARKMRTDALSHAIAVGLIAYTQKHGTRPTYRALFEWLVSHDTTGAIVDYDAGRDKLTWRKADGGLKDIEFKSFQNRLSAKKK